MLSGFVVKAIAGFALASLPLAAMAQVQFVVGETQGTFPVPPSNLTRHETQTGPAGSAYQTIQQQYVQTGLESLSIYVGARNAGSSPVATFQNVNLAFSPTDMAATGGYNGIGQPQYTGGPGTLTISDAEHPNLLSLQ